MDSTKNTSPVMAQYIKAKAEHQDAILFFRMGDFYEVFFEDAKTAAKALDIALTKRGNHNGEEIPMAGVPAHSVEGYLAKLVRQGFKIAICDQLETPSEAKKRGSKAVIKREVTRIITQGTLTEESLLDAKSANRLGAIIYEIGAINGALAWADISTGEFCVISGDVARLIDEAAALSISEILIIDKDSERASSKIFGAIANATTLRPAITADVKSAQKEIARGFKVASLEGFGDFSKAELQALGLIYDYITTTQAGVLPKLLPPAKILTESFLSIDPATRQSLEIEKSQKNARKNSLLGTIDFTITPQGGRLLANDLSRPLLDIEKINERFDAVESMINDPIKLEEIRDRLSQMPDMARPLSRLELARGGPRDLSAISRGLATANFISAIIGNLAPKILAQSAFECDLSGQEELAKLAQFLREFLADDLPLLARDGGFVRRGFDAVLDELIILRDESRRLIAALSVQVNQQAGQALKIKYNNVLGYFIEATPKQAPPLMEAPLNEYFIHRQTLSGMVRFTTKELIELNSKAARAGEMALARELELYEIAAENICALSQKIRATNDAIARIDVSQGLAQYANEYKCCRPRIDNSRKFRAIEARHPTVDAALFKQGGIFTANDCLIDGDGENGARLTLITGPNMAGKSTYLRQNALLVIIAQAGSFVPARNFEFGIVDKVFSRVGASDDLYSGQSTFMVEMIETAMILNRATERSFVILDEIGRGTATYDGLAIAWAVSEYLHDINKSRALFATHYHELTSLSTKLDFLANSSLSAKEWNGELVFLHRVIPGAADKSYGVQVAKLAGVPNLAINRAKEVLQILENGAQGAFGHSESFNELPLFAARPKEHSIPREKSELEKMFDEIDPNDLSPKDALELLFELKARN